MTLEWKVEAMPSLSDCWLVAANEELADGEQKIVIEINRTDTNGFLFPENPNDRHYYTVWMEFMPNTESFIRMEGPAANTVDEAKEIADDMLIGFIAHGLIELGFSPELSLK